MRELWYVLHGYGQLAAPFLDDFRAIDDGTRLIVAPEALSRFYEGDVQARLHKDAKVGASWMTREDRDAEIADYVAYLDTRARLDRSRGWRMAAEISGHRARILAGRRDRGALGRERARRTRRGSSCGDRRSRRKLDLADAERAIATR